MAATGLEPAIKLDLGTAGSGRLAERARTAILEAILDGRFEGRLPPEEELAEMLGVSRTSIRAALEGLEAMGLFTRRRSIGTTVNTHVPPTTLALDRLIGFDWLLRERGHQVEAETSCAFEPLPAGFAEGAEALAGVECCVMRTTYFANGVAAIGVFDAIPIHNLRRRRLPKSVPSSLFEFSRLYCRETIDHAIVNLIPMIARAGDSHLASIPAGHPFLRLRETHLTRSAAVVGWSTIDVNDAYIRFDVLRLQ